VQSVHPAFPYVPPQSAVRTCINLDPSKKISLVIKLRAGASDIGPVRLRSTEQPPDNHGARMALCLNARYLTESFAFFMVRVEVNQKTGLQMNLKAHLLSSGTFFMSLFYGEDDPEALTLN